MINENGVEITMAEHLVGEGAALLDRHFDGPQWRERIKLDTFDIADKYECVLGQLFASYSLGLRNLGLHSGYEHGFTAHNEAGDQELQEAWANYIDN